ncbi:MAG: hypothetical protein NC405_01440 [Odoribacter sp.]|nr:hypothetical protein [Odoribacter sp.]
MNIKHLLSMTIVVASLTASAATPQRLDIETGAFHPVLSPDGSTLLYSALDHTGLKALDMTTGTVTVIDAGASAGFQPVFSASGRQVYYRTASTVDGLLYRDVRSYDFEGRKVRTLAKPSRRDENLVAMAGDNYAYASFSAIEVFTDGVKSLVSPVTDAHSYQWASLSPDGSRLAFSEPFQGVFVSKADGSEPVKLLDKGDYVAWAGPNTVIAVVSHDDGYVILDSRLVMVNTATGIMNYITGEDIKVSEATASATGMVIFSDLDGNMYSLNIND